MIKLRTTISRDELFPPRGGYVPRETIDLPLTSSSTHVYDPFQKIQENGRLPVPLQESDQAENRVLLSYFYGLSTCYRLLKENHF